MIRNKAKRQLPISEINIVPYIDVMLVLLVIFMITAPMISQGVTVDLPKAPSQNLASADKEPIIVSVDEHGNYFLNVSATPAQPIEAEDLLLRVAAELELTKNAGEKINVLVKGDQGVSYGKVVLAMALLKKAGAEQVGLLTDSTEIEANA